MKTTAPVVVILSCALVGCRQVTPVEVVGTWTMDEPSRGALPSSLQNASAQIELSRNGTFLASQVPALFFFPGHRDERLESGNGVWKLVSSEGSQQVQLEFREIANWNAKELPYGTQLYISRGWSGVTLSYFIGDPDNGRRIDLKKN